MALCLFPDRRLSDRRFPDCTFPDHNNIPDHNIDGYIYPDLHVPRPVHRAIYALVREHVGRGTLYLYELVGECVYLYVGRGTCLSLFYGRDKCQVGVPTVGQTTIGEKT